MRPTVLPAAPQQPEAVVEDSRQPEAHEAKYWWNRPPCDPNVPEVILPTIQVCPVVVGIASAAKSTVPTMVRGRVQ
jgi:hypothetical protein